MANIIDVKNKILEGGIHNVTSDYKLRNKKRPNHNGIDIVSRKNNINTMDYIVAIDDGEVVAKGYDAQRGYYVNIKHKTGLVTVYYHLKKNTLYVNKGTKVKKGQRIGYMGNSGRSNGAHLHFGVLKNNIPLDPLPYLKGTEEINEKIVDHYKNFVIGVQKTCGAKVDGIAGRETLSKTITVSKNNNRKHKVVKVIQEYLYELGYKEVGESDGIAGNKFTEAVKNYQKDNNCVIDGVITAKAKTWKKLLKL